MTTTTKTATPEAEQPQDTTKDDVNVNKTQDETSKTPSSSNDGTDDNADDEDQPCHTKVWNWWCTFYANNEFVILVVIVICLARLYPPLGANYLQPQITSTWIAVLFIFVLAGLGLKTEEFSKALQRFKFNLFVQCFNFGVVSSIVYGISRGLNAGGIISQGLADGMVVCASLPLTINMVLVLTKSAGGDEASAIFNAAFGNMVGVFLSPVLILAYLGVTGDVALLDVFIKLALRVVLPVVFGQILQKTSQKIVDFVKTHKPKFKKAQQYCLVFIVYTVFCRTFDDDDNDASNVGDIFIMIGIQFVQLCMLMCLAWTVLRFLFPMEPELVAMGLYGCTHKTVAMGVPLINAIYEDNPLVGLYTLPLLIWHPMQLIVGSFVAPKVYNFVQAEKERLGIKDDDDDENDDNDDVVNDPEGNSKENGDEKDDQPSTILQDATASDENQQEDSDEQDTGGAATTPDDVETGKRIE